VFDKLLKRKPPLKEVLAQTIRRLEIQKRKLAVLSRRIAARERMLFNSTVAHFRMKDTEKAMMYANELAQVRKWKEIINNSMLMLERVIIRLQTVRDFGTAIIELKPALDQVKQVANELFSIYPDISDELKDVSDLLHDTLATCTIMDIGMESPVVSESSEVDAILKQAAIVARNKLEEELPYPPERIQAKASPVSKVALTATGEAEPYTASGFREERPVEVVIYGSPFKSPEERVYEYILTHGGRIDFAECAEVCGLSPDELQRILFKLAAEGKIRSSRVETSLGE